MKSPSLVTLALVLGLTTVTACRSTTPPTASDAGVTINLSGPAGTAFSGFYVQRGRRVVVADHVPWTLHKTGITEFEFRKARTDALLEYRAEFKASDGRSEASQSGQLTPGESGVRGRVLAHGLSAQRF